MVHAGRCHHHSELEGHHSITEGFERGDEGGLFLIGFLHPDLIWW